MIRIGIDPGVRECGVAIEWVREFPSMKQTVRSAFIVRAPRGLLLPQRGDSMACAIMQQLPTLIEPGLSSINLCVEGQQVYPSESAKGDPNDMIKLAAVAGILTGAIANMATAYEQLTMLMPLPREWKGNTPKKIHHARLARDYPHWVEPVERDTPKSLQNHVWDAVGLLEWHKERLQKS